jgi:hypothetical protein
MIASKDEKGRNSRRRAASRPAAHALHLLTAKVHFTINVQNRTF